MTAPTLDSPAGAAELIGVFEPGSPEWHAARADGIGGSEIAALLGLSTWDSRFSLWHRKRGIVPPREASTEMDAGRRLEPVINQVFEERHPEFLVRKGGTYRSTARPYQIANPDGLCFPWQCACGAAGEFLCSCLPSDQIDAIHEAKFALFDDHWGEQGTDEVPVYYQAQCRWYMDVFDVRRCFLTVFIGSTGEFREYVIEPDAEDTATMRAEAEEFMRTLAQNIRPKIDGHTATYQVVKDLPEGQVDMDVEIWPLLRDQYFDALDAFTAAEAEKRRAAALILDQIKDGRRAVCLSERVATRTVRNGKTFSLQPARNRGTSS